MRIVTTPNFCSVCIEGLWLSLLRRVNLLDDVTEDCQWYSETQSTTPHSDFNSSTNTNSSRSFNSARLKKRLTAHLIPLAQFRSDTDMHNMRRPKETYAITWSKNGKPLEDFANETTVEIDDDEALGTYTIDVKYTTEEVRLDKDGLLISGGEYTVAKHCSASDQGVV